MTTTQRAAAVTVDPSNEIELARYPYADAAGIDTAIARVAAAQPDWGLAGFAARAGVLREIASALSARREEAATLITAEMGKTLSEARAQVDKSVLVCKYYADFGADQLAPDLVQTDWAESYVQFPPLGTVLAIMPWNYPFWQVVRAAAPALMAGNTILLKHASNVSGSALLLRDIVADGTAGQVLLETVVAQSSAIADVIADPRIAAVTLTGSERAGIAVAEACARNLKPSVLELGGSDAFIVLADADVEAAARAAVTARFLNAGQSCIAGKRFIVVDAVAAEFEDAFASNAADLVMGDPREEGVDLGPMARVDLRDELADQLRGGLADGGRVLAGGEPPDTPGAFFRPTVVDDVSPENLLAREETFGPLAAVLRAKDDRRAIELANASDYGLSSSLWTGDVEKARALAGTISAGAVFVNAPSASDPRMPFGGVKRSGWGRELGSYGIREFVNTQAVTFSPKTS